LSPRPSTFPRHTTAVQTPPADCVVTPASARCCLPEAVQPRRRWRAPVAGAAPSSAPCSRPRMATRAVTYGAKTRRRLVVLVPDPVRGCGPPPQWTSGSGEAGFGAVCWCRVAETCREWDIVCWGISSGSVSLSKLSKKTLSY